MSDANLLKIFIIQFFTAYQTTKKHWTTPDCEVHIEKTIPGVHKSWLYQVPKYKSNHRSVSTHPILSEQTLKKIKSQIQHLRKLQSKCLNFPY